MKLTTTLNVIKKLKNPDIQKEKVDNQDSKDEVKSRDSKSISSLPFIILGVVAIVVVVAIVYFVCKGKLFQQKEKNEVTSKNDSNVSEPKLKPEMEKKVEELHRKLNKSGSHEGYLCTLEELKVIFEKENVEILDSLLSLFNSELTAGINLNLGYLFSRSFRIVLKKFLKIEKVNKGFFSKILKANAYDVLALLRFLSKFYKIDLDYSTICLLLEFDYFADDLLKEDNIKFTNFVLAILTGEYKGDKKICKLELALGDDFTFDGSKEGNLRKILNKYKEILEKEDGIKLSVAFLNNLVEAYDKWLPEQQVDDCNQILN